MKKTEIVKNHKTRNILLNKHSFTSSQPNITTKSLDYIYDVNNPNYMSDEYNTHMIAAQTTTDTYLISDKVIGWERSMLCSIDFNRYTLSIISLRDKIAI